MFVEYDWRHRTYTVTSDEGQWKHLSPGQVRNIVDAPDGGAAIMRAARESSAKKARSDRITRTLRCPKCGHEAQSTGIGAVYCGPHRSPGGYYSPAVQVTVPRPKGLGFPLHQDEPVMKKPQALNPPEQIFLQVGEIDQNCEFSECYQSGEVTWCYDRQLDSDVEYRLVKRRKRATPTVTVVQEKP